MHAFVLALLFLAVREPHLPDPGQLAVPVRSDPQGLLRVNTDFYRMSAETGGDFYFWAPGEFASAHLQIPLPGDHVAFAYGTLSPQGWRISIPVESGARRLSVFAGMQRKDFAVLRRPDGHVVSGTAAGESLQSFRYMIIAQIDSPRPGTWQLELHGAGLVSVSAEVAPGRDPDAPTFLGLRYVEMGGRPGHQGWFPIDREPAKGETLECSASLPGKSTSVAFRFVAADGEIVGRPMLAQVEVGGDFYGRCQVPAVPYRVMVTARDSAGQPFQRIEPGLRTPR
ncbi:hypothetical protein BH11PSE14_BH11PSE14_15850 [soil metagenome]